MPTAEELLVAIRSEGVRETREDLEDVEGAMDETANTTGRVAGTLSELASLVKGAMAAVVAGLAIGVAGVLSQVPVVGEAVAGLGAVFNAFVLQIDKKLRPGLTDLNSEFFELANAINEGDYKQAKEELGDIATELKNFSVDIDTASLAKAGGKAVGAVLDSFTKSMQNTSQEDYRAASDAFLDKWQKAAVASSKQVDYSELAKQLIIEFGQAVFGISEAIRKNVTGPIFLLIAREFFRLAEDAKEWGSDIIDNVIQGMQDELGDLRDFVDSIEVFGFSLGGVDSGTNTATNTTEPTRRQERLFSGRGTTLDGRQLSESTGRYRADPSRRRNI